MHSRTPSHPPLLPRKFRDEPRDARPARLARGPVDSARSAVVRVGFPFVPVAIGAAALVAVVALASSSSSSRKTTAHVDDGSAKQNAYDLGHDAGCAQGTEDKQAGKANLPPLSVDLSGYAKSGSPADYYAGYLAGYGACWATASVGVVPHDYEPPKVVPGTTDTMRAGETAYQYGCRRGTSSGGEDGKVGADSAWEDNLESTGSLKRQAESRDPAQYRAGYKSCYIGAYATAYATYGTLKPSEGTLGEGETEVAGTNDRDVRTGLFFNTGYGVASTDSANPTYDTVARYVPSFVSSPGSWGPRRTVLAYGRRYAGAGDPGYGWFTRVAGTAVGGVARVGEGVVHGAVKVGCACLDEALKVGKTAVGLFYNTGAAVLSTDSATPTYRTVAARNAMNSPSYSGLYGYDAGVQQGAIDRKTRRSYDPERAARLTAINLNPSSPPNFVEKVRQNVRDGYQYGWYHPYEAATFTPRQTAVGLFYNTGAAVLSTDSATPTYRTVSSRTNVPALEQQRADYADGLVAGRVACARQRYEQARTMMTLATEVPVSDRPWWTRGWVAGFNERCGTA